MIIEWAIDGLFTNISRFSDFIMKDMIARPTILSSIIVMSAELDERMILLLVAQHPILSVVAS